MRAKSERFGQKRRGYRARLQGKKGGVSDVVAILILILIAVAAAALYLWLVVWQGNLTGGIGNPHAQSTLTVGGSASAYPFTSTAATWFEQNNSDVSISDNQGGTTAGLLAVCASQLDIGVSSTPETVSTLETSYNCPSQYASTIQITTIAYDAVDVVIANGNTHGLLSINYDTLNVIYSQGSTNAPNIPVTGTSTIDGAAVSTLAGANAAYATIPAQGTEFEWAWLPAAVQGAAFPGIGVAADSPEAATTVATAVGAPCTGAAYVNDICATGGTGTGTPCGFTVCASGAALVVPIERADGAGNTQTFEAKLLGYTASNKLAASYSALGYSGCGSNQLLSDCGINLPSGDQFTGDTGVLGAVAASPNAIGYASDGGARSTTGIGTGGIVPFAALGQVSAAGVPSAANGFSQTSGSNTAYNGVIPTLSATGTIAGGVTSSTSVNQYSGWRPFQFISLTAYSGVGQEFVTFIMDPANNLNLATATHEVSIYSI